MEKCEMFILWFFKTLGENQSISVHVWSMYVAFVGCLTCKIIQPTGRFLGQNLLTRNLNVHCPNHLILKCAGMMCTTSFQNCLLMFSIHSPCMLGSPLYQASLVQWQQLDGWHLGFYRGGLCLCFGLLADQSLNSLADSEGKDIGPSCCLEWKTVVVVVVLIYIKKHQTIGTWEHCFVSNMFQPWPSDDLRWYFLSHVWMVWDVSCWMCVVCLWVLFLFQLFVYFRSGCPNL